MKGSGYVTESNWIYFESLFRHLVSRDWAVDKGLLKFCTKQTVVLWDNAERQTRFDLAGFISVYITPAKGKKYHSFYITDMSGIFIAGILYITTPNPILRSIFHSTNVNRGHGHSYTLLTALLCRSVNEFFWKFLYQTFFQPSLVICGITYNLHHDTFSCYVFCWLQFYFPVILTSEHLISINIT